MKAARIENGVVADLWEVPALDCYGDLYHLVEAPDGCQIGASYDGVAFTNPPPPTKTSAQIISELETAVQSHLNAAAKTHGYDDIKSAALRAGYPGPFRDEGVAYATWMDGCWAHCYQVLAAVQAGARTIPTAADLIAELPVLVLP